MRFSYPLFPAEFEIPDDWWSEAGMSGFTPSSEAYRSTASATLIPLRDIEPPFRAPECPKDFRGFERVRLLSDLNGIVTGAEIEPVPLLKLPSLEFTPSPYRYRVCDGFHRFYGFGCLPGEIIP
jgi:hypothetical protein